MSKNSEKPVMFRLSYETLRACQLKGMRNGNWRLLDRVQKGFYRACMAYARLREAIVNPKLVGHLRALIEKLKSTMRARALEVAIKEVERVAPIYSKAGIFRWAPCLYRWLHEEPYLVWLGFTRLNTPCGQTCKD